MKLNPPQGGKGLSTSTVKYLHAILHRGLGQAYQWGLVPRNVAGLVKPPRIERAEVRPFTPEQARTFLRAIKGYRLEALYSVALSVGLRQGEALGLSWEDVDLEQGTLQVRQQLQHLRGEFSLVPPKTKGSRRTIELPAFSVRALREHQVRQEREKTEAGPEWQDWGSAEGTHLVFTTIKGTPLDPRNVTHRFQALLERLKLPRMRFHDLRHACATLLLVQGEHPRVVMEILGHGSFGMTMNTYSHVVPSLKRDAASKMDRLLGYQEGYHSKGAEHPERFGGQEEGASQSWKTPLSRSGREDLNLRPPEPHSGALPDCATARESHYRTSAVPASIGRNLCNQGGPTPTRSAGEGMLNG
jgi:integrase